jgi:hypothetical protein
MGIGNDFQERVFAAAELFKKVEVTFNSPKKCTLAYGDKMQVSVEVEEMEDKITLTVTGPRSALGVRAPGSTSLAKNATPKQIADTFSQVAAPAYRAQQVLLKQAEIPAELPKDINGRRLFVGQPVRLLCAPQNEHAARCMEKTGVIHGFSEDKQYAVLHFSEEKDLRVPTWHIIGLRRKKYGTRSN